jgi:hypothetical protein
MFLRPATAALATGLGVSLLSLQPTPAADAAVRLPDLVISAVSAPAEVRAGTSLQVSVTTKNLGRRRSAASRTKIYLSVDRARGGDIAVASLRVPRLRPNRRQVAQVALQVPAGAAARRYHLLACADAFKQVRESRERNNCRVSDRTVRVTQASSAVPDFPLTPDPITVDPNPDDARAVSKTVNPFEKTTIKATGADGTTYTLVIPTDALIGPETITLTPVSAVGDLPLSGGLEAAVQLEPHGLVLLKQATLTIDATALGPIAQQTPFYFHEGGEDFHLYPTLPPRTGDDASVVRLPIEHFSTAGVGLATPGDRAGVGDHPTARDQGQIAGQIAELIRKAREGDPNGDGPVDSELAPSIEALMNSYYDGVVKPQLAAAENNPRNDALVRDAIADALSWVRNMQLYLSRGDNPYSSTRTDDAMDRIERVLKAVYLDRWNRCSQDHELEVLPQLLTVARQAALLGYAWADAPFERFKDCSRYEVRFDSRISFDGEWAVGGEELYKYPHTGSGDWRAKATTSNALGEGTFITQGPLSLTQATYHDSYSYPRSDGSICSGGTDQTGSVPGTIHTGVSPSFEPNPKEVPPDGVWQEPIVKLVISASATGVKDITRSVDCSGGDYTNTDTSRWLSQFIDFHGGFGSISVTGTKADRSGEVLYAKTWINSDSTPTNHGSLDWSETTVLEVWHKPAA